MIFEIETVRNSPIVKEDSRLVAYGHGAYGEPDNTYQDYKYVWLNRELVEVHDRQYLVFDENRVLLEVVNDYDLPETARVRTQRAARSWPIIGRPIPMMKRPNKRKRCGMVDAV
jgi:hypothetical protein